MGQITKQVALYIGLLLVCSSFTLIFPFYPKIAESKGVDLWLIGLIFSLNPIVNVLCTPFLGKYMHKIGRKRIVVASFVMTGLSMFILCPIEMSDKETLLILSVISRICSGFAVSFVFTSVTSIFVSDYPDNVLIMIGRMEAAVGIGLILGPIIGTGLYFMQLFGALIFSGGLVILFAPIASKMLGTFHDLKTTNAEVNSLPLLLKPKIFLTLMMDAAFLFSYGLIATVLEVHLDHFGFNSLEVAMVFVMGSVLYLIISFVGGHWLKHSNERLCMAIGVLSLAVGYLMLAPWRVIFPNEVWVVILSIPFISLGQCFCYSIFYIVFSIPYMQRSACEDYGYKKSDMLDEQICSYSVTACGIGEIIGPIYAGMVTDFYGIEICCVLISGVSVVYCIIFIIGTGMVSDLCKRKHIKIDNISELEASITK
ncbi:hypothetical protein SteCoe_31760 [Stentor coeruleus]|uniref:Major facilitator superfamily (MFS) profile domain-containing protein n=1 Tax=Stentor coeruleus TaxID=5963 RepID=A0A1R2B0I9_9CILI|nr:hypothetical protein SteCoe_31760 [Stentor coeruleus]